MVYYIRIIRNIETGVDYKIGILANGTVDDDGKVHLTWNDGYEERFDTLDKLRLARCIQFSSGKGRIIEVIGLANNTTS